MPHKPQGTRFARRRCLNQTFILTVLASGLSHKSEETSAARRCINQISRVTILVSRF